MAKHSLRKSQLIAFDNAAAGHDGVLADLSGELIVKPCCQAEIDFYQSAVSHPAFQYYTPKFWGTLSLSSHPVVTQSSSDRNLPDISHVIAPFFDDGHPTTPTLPAWNPSNGGKIDTNTAIVLENMAAHFKKPNVLDVKLGARLWADDAPPAKRQKLEKVAAETTSQALGFRIAGMKIWQGEQANENKSTGTDGYRVYDKAYGRSLTVETVRQGFEDFFLVKSAAVTKTLGCEVIQRFLKDLRGLREVIESEESRMYSASLLFIYEGDGNALQYAFDAEKSSISCAREPVGDKETAEEPVVDGTASRTSSSGEEDDEAEDDEEEKPHLPKIQAIKLIDFAHAEWTPGKGPDENLLHGVRNVIKILEDLCKC